MAVPGAGKTRSVREAASAVRALYFREKLTDAHDFVVEVRAIANERKGPPLSYQAGKDFFVKACQKFVRRVLNEGFDLDNEGEVLVLHFDEVQALMGKQVVGSTMPPSANLFDYVMPAFGDAINKVTTSNRQLRVALAGTFFFCAFGVKQWIAFEMQTHRDGGWLST